MLPRHVTRRLVLRLAAGAGAFALTGCNTTPRRFREKLVLTVTTPEGTVSGSSVIEYDIEFQDGWLGGIAGHSLVPSMRGQAAVVDLGQRGLLSALLIRDETRRSSRNRGMFEERAFPDLERQARSDADSDYSKGVAYFVDALNRVKPTGDLPIEALSLLVRFRDPQDPRTIERVDPFDLPASFGAGVKLARATIGITDEPASTGIENTLRWLVGGALEQPLIPHTGPPRLASETVQVDYLIYRDFSTSDRFTFF